MSRPAARTPGRTGWFVSSIVLLIVACSLATALTCAVGYALSGERRPIVLISDEAATYARQSLFTDEAQMAAFSARLDALAAATGTSVVVAYVERPRPGQTLTAAMERSLDGIEAALARRTDAYEPSMLAIVLMGKPRIFGFIGIDQARTRIFLRNLSGDPAVHSLNFKHIQVTHGRYLMQGLGIAQEALRPLHVLVEHHPAQWLVVAALENMTGSLPELPNDALLAIARTVRAPLARLATEHGVPPIVLLLVPLGLLAGLIKLVERSAESRLKRVWLRNAAWALCRTIPISVSGIVAVVLYGSLENIASLSQMSGQPLLDLLHLARSLPTPTIPAWLTWAAIPAASVIALGVTVGIGLRLTGGDAHKLITPSRWFAGWWLPLRLVLLAIAVPLVLLLPVPLMVALASMEGLMAVSLLVSMLVAWADDLYRFWMALGDELAAA